MVVCYHKGIVLGKGGSVGVTFEAIKDQFSTSNSSEESHSLVMLSDFEIAVFIITLSFDEELIPSLILRFQIKARC